MKFNNILIQILNLQVKLILCHLSKLLSVKFLVYLTICQHLCSQKKIDLVYFLKHADELKNKDKDMREGSEAMFHPFIIEGTGLCQDYEISIRMPI